MLDFFTFDEMRQLFDFLSRKHKKLKQFLDDEKKRGFERLERTVRDWYEKTITLREGSEIRTEYDQFDKRASRMQ